MSVATLTQETLFALARFPHLYRLKNLSDRLVKPHISLNFSNQFYQVKTVDTVAEFEQVLRLRYEVFFQEFSSFKSQWNLIPYDIDRLDFSFDHLIVKDLKNDRVIACYRVLSSQVKHKVSHYYSEGEFELGEFLQLPGNKLELGRACVHKDFRKGTVIALLWKGLMEYAKRAQARWLFGCASVTRKDFEKVGAFLSYLDKNSSSLEGYEISPKKSYDPKKHGISFSRIPHEEGCEAKQPLGGLVTMYLKAGARISPQFAYDADFDCLDFFTVMNLEEMSVDFERKFAQ